MLTCASRCVHASVCVCLSVCVSTCACVCVSACARARVCECQCACVDVSMNLSCICVSVCLCLCVHVSELSWQDLGSSTCLSIDRSDFAWSLVSEFFKLVVDAVFPEAAT